MCGYDAHSHIFDKDIESILSHSECQKYASVVKASNNILTAAGHTKNWSHMIMKWHPAEVCGKNITYLIKYTIFEELRPWEVLDLGVQI